MFGFSAEYNNENYDFSNHNFYYYACVSSNCAVKCVSSINNTLIISGLFRMHDRAYAKNSFLNPLKICAEINFYYFKPFLKQCPYTPIFKSW